MKVYRYLGVGHLTGPGGYSYDRSICLACNDVIILVERVDSNSFIVLPSGTVRTLSYRFWESVDFVEISL